MARSFAACYHCALLKTPLLILIVVTFAACAAPRSGPKTADEFPLLNPLLRAQPDLQFTELQPFNFKLRALAEESKRAGLASHVSVYFRDLENGPMRGVNFDEKFTPASLLKVPLMLAVLKQAEKDPAFLSRRLKFEIPSRTQSYLSARVLVPGQEYTVEEAVAAMISGSDNDAFYLLQAVVSPDEYLSVYQDFGMVIPGVRGTDAGVSVRQYATFFRVLYNASYLEKRMSQKALGYLADAVFKDGLVAGVPPGVVVAHKYGERFDYQGSAKQLHDCGIVYHPRRHYVLCVMTRGEDFAKMSGVIKAVSEAVYSEVGRHGSR